ncbi:MAG: hypothetical protein J6B20_03020 [Clostridia bacterium]|nr:hypothetical protein [Clostridia bacterium]
MNIQMAYLLGMIIGNGEIQRNNSATKILINIPHKNERTDDGNDVKIYVKASITDIKSALEPTIGTILNCTQNKSVSTIYFEKPNSDYLITEIMRMCQNERTFETMHVPQYFYTASRDEILYFLRGFCDVTAYIRKSNCYIDGITQRVYIEIMHNWYVAAEICNLLKIVDIPVQTIDWAHPNMRDGKLAKYNQGNHNFWKKEHQIKITANEFLPIGFTVIHKNNALEKFANEMINYYSRLGKNISEKTHKFYWQKKKKRSLRPSHPGESDVSIPSEIRGKHYDCWQDIANDLGYRE